MSIEDLKTEYETAQHFANVAKDKATEAKTTYHDALVAEKTAEIEAKGIVIGETKVKVSYPSKIKEGKMIEEKGLFIVTGVSINRWDINKARVNCARLTKAGVASRGAGGTIHCGDDYVIEVVT